MIFTFVSFFAFFASKISCLVGGGNKSVSVGLENIVPYEESVRGTNSEEVARLEVVACHPLLEELGCRDE